MQEEIEHKTVNLAISTTKLSARTLLRGMQFLLRQYDKHASQGKQSMKRLVRQNRGVTNVVIQRTGMRMNFNHEELMLMMLYNTGTRLGLIHELRLMQCYLMPDETALRELSVVVIEKLKLLTDAEFGELEFPPD